MSGKFITTALGLLLTNGLWAVLFGHYEREFDRSLFQAVALVAVYFNVRPV